jgi:hypothetical protein
MKRGPSIWLGGILVALGGALLAVGTLTTGAGGWQSGWQKPLLTQYFPFSVKCVGWFDYWWSEVQEIRYIDTLLVFGYPISFKQGIVLWVAVGGAAEFALIFLLCVVLARVAKILYRMCRLRVRRWKKMIHLPAFIMLRR